MDSAQLLYIKCFYETWLVKINSKHLTLRWQHRERELILSLYAMQASNACTILMDAQILFSHWLVYREANNTTPEMTSTPTYCNQEI